MSKVSLNIKNTVILGNGEVSVLVLNDEQKNLSILFGNIKPTKIGTILPKEMDEEDSYSEIKIKNSASALVLLKATKSIYKELKRKEKQLGLTK